MFIRLVFYQDIALKPQSLAEATIAYNIGNYAKSPHILYEPIVNDEMICKLVYLQANTKAVLIIIVMQDLANISSVLKVERENILITWLMSKSKSNSWKKTPKNEIFLKT